jgi:hypothetical protein
MLLKIFWWRKKKYWIPKLHRNPYRERYITSPAEALLRPSG